MIKQRKSTTHSVTSSFHLSGDPNNMNQSYFVLFPEPIGGTSDLPPHVARQHGRPYAVMFEGWSGDHLVKTSSEYLISTELTRSPLFPKLTGCSISPAIIRRRPGSGLFAGPLAGRFPEWHWLCINGVPSNDDFGIAEFRLVVSQRTLDLLSTFPFKHCEIYSTDSAPSPEEREKMLFEQMRTLRAHSIETF